MMQYLDENGEPLEPTVQKDWISDCCGSAILTGMSPFSGKIICNNCNKPCRIKQFHDIEISVGKKEVAEKDCKCEKDLHNFYTKEIKAYCSVCNGVICEDTRLPKNPQGVVDLPTPDCNKNCEIKDGVCVKEGVAERNLLTDVDMETANELVKSGNAMFVEKEEVADWETEFEDKWLEGEFGYYVEQGDRKHIKQFITKTLADQKARQREKVVVYLEERQKDAIKYPAKMFPPIKNRDEAYNQGYDQALSDIINHLKNNE